MFVGLICAIVATVLVVKEKPVPRGCGCIPMCAEAQDGLCTLPGVPWFNAIYGGIAFISGVITLMYPADDTEDELEIAKWVIIAGIFYNFNEMVVGVAWLNRYVKQYGFLCCYFED